MFLCKTDTALQGSQNMALNCMQDVIYSLFYWTVQFLNSDFFLLTCMRSVFQHFQFKLVMYQIRKKYTLRCPSFQVNRLLATWDDSWKPGVETEFELQT